VVLHLGRLSVGPASLTRQLRTGSSRRWCATSSRRRRAVSATDSTATGWQNGCAVVTVQPAGSCHPELASYANGRLHFAARVGPEFEGVGALVGVAVVDEAPDDDASPGVPNRAAVGVAVVLQVADGDSRRT
jgi:hypothetical protein